MLHDQGQVKVEMKEFKPVICFDDFNKQLYYNSGEQFELHEYTFGNTDEAFEN